MYEELHRTGRSCPGLTEVLSEHFPRGTKENHEKPVRITGVPTEIRTNHLSNMNLGRCHYTFRSLGDRAVGMQCWRVAPYISNYFSVVTFLSDSKINRLT
jgi:hypothetical protein